MWSWVGPANVAPRSEIPPPTSSCVHRPAADAVARLEHDYGLALVSEAKRGGEAGEACPHDHDVGVAAVAAASALRHPEARERPRGGAGGRRSDQPAPA